MVSYIRQVIIQLFGWDKAQKDEKFNAQLCMLGHFYFSSLNGGKTVHHFVACPWFALSFTWRAMDHDSGSTELSVNSLSPRVEQDVFDLDSLNHSALSHFFAGRFAWNLCYSLIKYVSWKGECDQPLINGTMVFKI